MRKKALSVFGLAVVLVLAQLTGRAQAQAEIDPRHKRADTNNAVIEGRVALPSGFIAERPIKITLRNPQAIISTRYTSKHGEFRFDNLPESVYFIEASVDEFEMATRKVPLGRGMIAQVTLQLTDRQLPLALNLSRVVSVAELRQSVPPAAKREYELGLKDVAKGNVPSAATHFEQAITVYPEYLAARNDLGAQFLKLKRVDEAEKHFQIVIQQDPKNFNAQFNLGLVRIERKAYQQAIAELNRAIVIDSTRPVARLWLGFAHLEMGDVATAERELTKALVMGGAQCLAAHYHLARIYLARGDRNEALRSVRAYLQDAPKGEHAADAKVLESQIERLR